MTSAAPIRLAGLRMGSGSLPGDLARRPGNHEAFTSFRSRAVNLGSLMASTQDRSDSLPAFSPDGRRLAYVSCHATAISGPRSMRYLVARTDCRAYAFGFAAATDGREPPVHRFPCMES